MVLAAVLLNSAQVRFTSDQCRVLRQTGVDTTDLCPPPRPKTEKKAQ